MKDICNVTLSPQALKDLKKVPLHIAIKLQAWIDDVGHRGLMAARKIPGYHDEPLKGKRQRQRSLKALEKITGAQLRLGHLLAAIRQAEEMTVTAFAQKLSISKQYLCDLEHHRKCPSPKLAAAYAEKLGYSPEQFVRLALQEKLNQDGLHFQVELTPLAA